VEWLSGKPVELGPSHARLVPVPVGRAPVIPQRAGARQNLMGGQGPKCKGLVVLRIAEAQQGLNHAGLRVEGWYPGKLVGLALGCGPAWTGNGNPGGHGLGGAARGRVFPHGVGWRLEAGEAEGRIPLGAGLVWGCGLAQPEGRGAQQNGGAGIWQAGCSFIRLWHGEAFHDLSV
jgi:hypothetical protein